MIRRRRKYWGWGFEDERVDAREREQLAAVCRELLGIDTTEAPEPPPPDQLNLPASRVRPPAGLCDTTDAPYERVIHAGGKSFPDLVRARAGRIDHPPDLVAYPANPDEVAAVLGWAAEQQVAVIPFGGGTSVTGGVEPRVGGGFGAAISLDLTRMGQVLEVDEVSHLVHAEAGIMAPDLDAALRERGLTIRHYPQSYYFSTLGGWVATRSGGHYSTLLGKIDDRVAGLEVVAANGTTGATRPLPAGSVGPDPNRLWIGSEGALGVITKAWVRVLPEPQFKRTAAVQFPTFEIALEAARAIVQAGLHPAHLRVLDPFEALVSATVSGVKPEGLNALMILGFESPSQPVDALLKDALRITSRFKGLHDGPGAGAAAGESNDAVEGWRHTFFRQPYLRDIMIGWGMVVDTFETAIHWRGAQQLYADVRAATQDALMRACGGGGVLARTTHAYPDGVAFYFSFFGTGRRGEELAQWRAVKEAATDAVIAAGGTASHHHAGGRDHAPWADQELPTIWRQAFGGAKAALDPRGILNPGVIFPLQD